jgi:hypothetical protein
MKYVKLFEQFILESGNSVDGAIPFKQDQVMPTVDWVVKNIFPELGLVGLDDDSAILGSAGKKLADQTSGDVDLAVSADKIAGHLGVSLDKTLFALNDKLKSMGYSTKMAVGFNQVSIGVPIAGDPKNGVGQLDFMLSTDLDWSKFIYHSPDFRAAESKYKGAYRNLLLMATIGKSFFEITKSTDKGEVAEYKAYVVRLNQGIVEVRKSFEGKKGLVKTAQLLKQYDKEITREPQKVVDLLFNGGHKPSDIDTYEKLLSLLQSGDFKYPNVMNDILSDFKGKLEDAGLPLPEGLG